MREIRCTQKLTGEEHKRKLESSKVEKELDEVYENSNIQNYKSRSNKHSIRKS